MKKIDQKYHAGSGDPRLVPHRDIDRIGDPMPPPDEYEPFADDDDDEDDQ